MLIKVKIDFALQRISYLCFENVCVKNKKNSVSIALIISSLGFLLMLQVLWLRSAYKDARSELARTINQSFKSTVYTMHDSLIQKSIIPLMDDSSHTTRKFIP